MWYVRVTLEGRTWTDTSTSSIGLAFDWAEAARRDYPGAFVKVVSLRDLAKT